MPSNLNGSLVGISLLAIVENALATIKIMLAAITRVRMNTEKTLAAIIKLNLEPYRFSFARVSLFTNQQEIRSTDRRPNTFKPSSTENTKSVIKLRHHGIELRGFSKNADQINSTITYTFSEPCYRKAGSGTKHYYHRSILYLRIQ